MTQSEEGHVVVPSAHIWQARSMTAQSIAVSHVFG
jgi:hypothetical protein